MRLSAAISNNPKAALTHLDLSDNVLEDKGQSLSCMTLCKSFKQWHVCVCVCVCLYMGVV